MISTRSEVGRPPLYAHPIYAHPRVFTQALRLLGGTGSGSVILPRKSGHDVGPVAVYGREVVHGEGATARLGSRFVVKRWLRCRVDSGRFGAYMQP